MSVLAIASNFQKAFSKNSTTLEQKWFQPEPNFIKLNVDAAYFEEKGAGATTTILQDDQGKFLAAECKLVPYAADVVTTETMTMRDGTDKHFRFLLCGGGVQLPRCDQFLY